MTGTHLEDRLAASYRRRAEEMSAPDTAELARRIDQRASRLARRRQVGRIAAASALTALVASGGLWLRAPDGDRVGDDEEVVLTPSGPAQDDTATSAEDVRVTPIVLDGREPTMVMEDDSDEPPPTGRPVPPPYLQVFRQPGNLAGPAVWVSHYSVVPEYGSFPQVGVDGATAVEVNGQQGVLSTFSPGVPQVGWPLPAGDVVRVRGWGLTAEELLATARGLARRPDGPGFDATTLPAGLAEDPIELAGESVTQGFERTVLYTEGVEVTTQMMSRAGGEDLFETYLGDRVAGTDVVEQLTVLGRPAVLTHRGGEDGVWNLLWRHNAGSSVEVIMRGDRASVDGRIAALRELDEAAWLDLLARCRAATASGTTPSSGPPSCAG